MTIHTWLREYILRYSFITKTDFKNAVLSIYYEKDGKQKKKKLPYRATQEQVIICIESIKKDIDFVSKQRKRAEMILKEGKKESAVIFSN